jgi:hypothetical protein
MKPRVLIFVLCGRERSDWINPGLFLALLRLRSERLDITVNCAYDFKPYETARNWCVQQARAQHADLWFSSTVWKCGRTGKRLDT